MTHAASIARPKHPLSVAGSRATLITGIGSITFSRSIFDPSRTITAAGTSDFTSRVTDRRLNMLPMFVAGFSRSGFRLSASPMNLHPTRLRHAHKQRHAKARRQDHTQRQQAGAMYLHHRRDRAPPPAHRPYPAAGCAHTPRSSSTQTASPIAPSASSPASIADRAQQFAAANDIALLPRLRFSLLCCLLLFPSRS